MKWFLWLFLFVLTRTFAGQVGDPWLGVPLQVSPVPGATLLIEAENFDKGGEGIAYHDPHFCNTSTTCSCKQTYRPDGVNVCTEDFSKYYISYDDAGMWVEYTIRVNAVGMYTLELLVAFNDSGCCAEASYHAEVDGVRVTETIPLGPALTGGWTIFEWRGKSALIGLIPGVHRLRIVVDKGWFNWDALRLRYAAGIEWQQIPVWKVYP